MQITLPFFFFLGLTYLKYCAFLVLPSATSKQTKKELEQTLQIKLQTPSFGSQNEQVSKKKTAVIYCILVLRRHVTIARNTHTHTSCLTLVCACWGHLVVVFRQEELLKDRNWKCPNWLKPMTKSSKIKWCSV